MANFHTDNEDLKPFYNEINNYSVGVHQLNIGARIDEIHNFEEKYKVNLPKVYKDFLQVSNGGEIFFPGTVFAEVYISQSGPMIDGVFYLDSSFYIKDKEDLPHEYLPIAILNYGDIVCIDLQKSNDYEAPVVQWDIESKEISRKWNRIVDWLMDALEEGAMLVDYEGNDKELDF